MSLVAMEMVGFMIREAIQVRSANEIMISFGSFFGKSDLPLVEEAPVNLNRYAARTSSVNPSTEYGQFLADRVDTFYKRST